MTEQEQLDLDLQEFYYLMGILSQKGRDKVTNRIAALQVDAERRPQHEA